MAGTDDHVDSFRAHAHVRKTCDGGLKICPVPGLHLEMERSVGSLQRIFLSTKGSQDRAGICQCRSEMVGRMHVRFTLHSVTGLACLIANVSNSCRGLPANAAGKEKERDEEYQWVYSAHGGEPR